MIVHVARRRGSRWWLPAMVAASHLLLITGYVAGAS